IDYFGAQLIDDYDKYTAACVMLEAAERLSLDDDPFLYELVIDTLKDLQDTKRPMLVLDTFLLLAMEHAGWAPSLFNCPMRRAGTAPRFPPGYRWGILR